eukprot:6039989-Pyramimonas_sp.AAC.1
MTARRAEAKATGAAARGGCHCGRTVLAGKAALLQLGRKQTYRFSTSESGRHELGMDSRSLPEGLEVSDAVGLL